MMSVHFHPRPACQSLPDITPLTSVVLALACALSITRTLHAESFIPPALPHESFNFNPGWRFFKGDVTNAEQASFDDSKWSEVAAPHTYNDTDSYTDFISHSGGDRHPYADIAWYRKHFKLPANAKNEKVFLEFEGVKQAARFWVNGKFLGRFENGITPVGLDLTANLNFGSAENVIAVKVDNSNSYKEESTGVEFQWVGRAFNPNYGGLNRNIRLHLTGKVYQTLPLFENLRTTGIYVYGSNFDIRNKSCDVNVESQVRNESSEPQAIMLEVVVMDFAENVCARFQGELSDLVSGQTAIFKAGGKLTSARFWSDETPSLYDVYCQLTVNNKVVDLQKITTGFRKYLRASASTSGAPTRRRSSAAA
jgi:beta-galactosidase